MGVACYNESMITTNITSCFKGPDASPEISLLEYGFAYLNTEDEITCIFGIKKSGGEFSTFGRATFSSNLNVYKEFNWIKDWQHEVFCYFDCDQEYFDNNLDLGNKLYWIMLIYGWENVFGTSDIKEFQIK